MSAKSKTINNVRYITATVAGKPVNISEASIISDLLFDDADEIDTLNNQAIFVTIQLMGYKGDLTVLTFNKALFSPHWKFLFHTTNHCISSKSTSWDQIPTNIATVLKNVPVSLDHFPINALTSKVLSFMVKKGKKISGNVTPLFDSMLVQPTEDEGEASEKPSESQPIPSPSHPSEDQPKSQSGPSPRPSPSIPIPDSNLEGLVEIIEVTIQAKEIKDLKAQIKKLKKKKKWMQKESVSRQGRKTAKSKPTAHKDQAFDDFDAMDYMEIEDAHNENGPDEGTDKQDASTVKSDEGTDKQNGGTDRTKVSTDSFVEGTAEIKDQVSGESDTPTVPTMTSTPTPTVFGDDETIAQVLVTMSQNKLKQKEKGVELKNVEDIERPRPTLTRSLLTLKPLPKIDPKAKGKGMIEEEDESDTESEDINEAEKKFKMLANDEEMARKVQEEWEAEEEKKRLAEEEATKAAFTNEYDFIQARLNADKILAEKLQEEEREKFTIEERAKLLHDTIAAQRRFLAQQRSEVIRNKLPSRTQLRNQMMTYLKHVGGKKHSDLKTKFFEEIQVLYEKVKRSDENFIAIGSVEDERLIKDLNKKADIKKDDSIKEESKEEEGTKKRKLGTRKKMKSRKRRFRKDTSEDDETNSEKENDELRLCLTIAPDEDKEVDYEILDKKYPIIEWKSEYLGNKPQYDETKDLEEINLNVVIRSNGQKRCFSTLMRMLSIFDREDLSAVYQLVMDRYQDEIPEGFDRVLWGDLMIMFNPSDEDEFWNSQQDWNVVSWKLHGSSGVHTLMTEAGLVIHMLVEKKYP
ncbi:hypothetical protein Tco_1031738 [Tanacetum coccineum]|uniref:Uncharacterized protein n=1 Tax=Tanacetum coccineum TaxID=301880 RepID=A0ABQ5G9V7_9ASTR